jgi:hypothetical protein
LLGCPEHGVRIFDARASELTHFVDRPSNRAGTKELEIPIPPDEGSLTGERKSAYDRA